jgi:hypothetical protein
MPSPSSTVRLVKRDITEAPEITTAVDLTLTEGTHGGRIIRTTAGNKDLTLPAISAVKSGTQFTMVVGVATGSGGATLKVAGTDTVNAGTGGKGLTNSHGTDAVGDSVTVYSDGSAGWYTIGKVGTWAAES